MMNANPDQRAGFASAVGLMERGTYKASGDQLVWSLWDSFLLDNTVLTHRLFINGLGTPLVAGGFKNMADTNVVGRTGVPFGHHLKISAVKMFYTPLSHETWCVRRNE